MTTDPSTGRPGGVDEGGTAAADPDADRYRVAVDRDACGGVFACLVRDDRFVEAADGLADFAVDEAESVERTTGGDGTGPGGTVTATFADDRIDDARAAATACPLDAITVSTMTAEAAVVDGSAVDDQPTDDAPEEA